MLRWGKEKVTENGDYLCPHHTEGVISGKVQG